MIAILILALFSYDEVVRTDLVAHAKIRWSKIDKGKRAWVEIEAGRAIRENPNWAPQPQRLKYDLALNRELQRVIKWANLPAAKKKASESPNDRTLEVLVEDDKGYHSAGYWSMSVKAWQKGRYGSIFDALDPLLDVKPELFDEKKIGPETQGGFVPR
jgi:hypothetical protein